MMEMEYLMIRLWKIRFLPKVVIWASSKRLLHIDQGIGTDATHALLLVLSDHGSTRWVIQHMYNVLEQFSTH